MSVYPSEIIIVDGGSTDGSIDTLHAFREKMSGKFPVNVIVDPTCTIHHSPSPIAKGRNTAIRSTSYEIIAVTDAGCIVTDRWLEKITQPFLEHSDVQMVGGWYEPLATTYFEQCQALAVYTPAAAVNPHHFYPSSRSVAFRKKIWEEVGGYPEVSYTAEDTQFDLRIKERTNNIRFSGEAIVFWRMRPSLQVFTKMNYRYGFGEGFCRMPMKSLMQNSIKMMIALILVFMAVINPMTGLPLFLVYVWLLPFVKDIRRAFRIRYIFHYPTVSLLKLHVNFLYIIGYLHGRMNIVQPKFHKTVDSRSAGPAS